MTKRCATLAAAILLVATSGLAQTGRRAGGRGRGASGITIGAVEIPRGRNMECSCGFRSVLAGSTSPTRVFISEVGNAVGSKAWMNVNGQVRTLSLTGRTETAKPLKLWSRRVQTYNGPRINATGTPS